jgi:CheY-like chemotaxis protein
MRRVAVRQLEDLGYRVRTAENGPEALAIFEREPGIDLLFTDIIMPEGLTGYDLARTAQRQRPDLKVLFASGYTELSVRNGNENVPGSAQLTKPYRKQELALTIRHILDQE